MKTTKIAILTILVSIIVMAAPASAYFGSQDIETKAERMVDIADEAQTRVLDLVAIVEANATATQLITDAGLDEQFYGNVSLCVPTGTIVGGELTTEDGEGWTYLNSANVSLLAGEYEDAIEYARQALEIFRDAYRAINAILCDAGVDKGQLFEAPVIQEAIDRSLERIEKLRALLADDEMLAQLDEAEDLLNEAQDLLNLEEIEDSTAKLRDANVLISQVCQDLRDIAIELNPTRVRGFLEEASQYRERFRERFRNAQDEEFDVNGFLNEFGYQNEEDFMNQFQQMIENAQGTGDIQGTINELTEIGRMIREMDETFTYEMGQHQAHHGQQTTTNGGSYGQEGTGTNGGQFSGSGSEQGSGFGGMGR